MTNKEQDRSTPVVKTTAPNMQASNTAKGKPEQDNTAMLKTEIKKAWNKLTDEDVSLYESQPDLFFARVKEKHSLSREQAEKRLLTIRETCGSACGSDKKIA